MTASLALQKQPKPPKVCQSCIVAAVRIAAALPSKVHPRYHDYKLAANTLAAFILVRMDRAKEALEFITKAEKALVTLIDYVVD